MLALPPFPPDDAHRHDRSATSGPGRLPLAVAVAFVAAILAGILLPRSGWFGRHASTLGTGSLPLSPLPPLENAGPWIQHAITADSLRGHIVLLVLWSDTNPRALRVLPEVEGWHLAYSRFGVRVIGVHRPDFAFAADTTIPARIARRLGLTFPIISDVSYRIWGQLHRLQERPSFYLADTSGKIVFEIGGSRTLEVERALRGAIAHARPGSGVPTDGGGTPPPAPAPPEKKTVYLGTSRVEAGPLAGAEPGHPAVFTVQFRFQEEGQQNVPYPVGNWTPGAEGLSATRGGAATYLSIRTGPGQVWAVLSPPPAAPERAARVWILASHQWMTRDAAGSDVRFDARGASYVDVTEPRLYSIARCPAGCVLQLSPDADGTTFYSFVVE